MVKKNSARDKKRSAEYNRIKSNLFKKAGEFSILCEVPVCTIIYPEKGDDQTQKPEVFSVNCGSEVPPDEIIQRYLAVPEEEKRKRSRTGTSSKICENEPNLKSVNQMLDYLDSKIDDVKRKIAEKQSESETQIISNHQVDYNNQVLLMGSNSLSSYYDQITRFNHNAMPLQLDLIQCYNHHTRKYEVFSFYGGFNSDGNNAYAYEVGSNIGENYQGFNGTYYS